MERRSAYNLLNAYRLICKATPEQQHNLQLAPAKLLYEAGKKDVPGQLADAVMNGGSHHRAYDFETKLAVARDRVERGKSVREVMIAHGVTSESSVKMWCRKYRDGGADALVEKRRGRRPASGERRDDA